jgi:lipoprotein-anchoring transpeptidase ErfK/SrfK
MRRSKLQASGGDPRDRRRVAALAVLAVAAAVAAPGKAAAATPKQAIVAEARVPAVAVYRTPHAKRPVMTLRNPNAHGARLVFLVKSRRAGWERVYLPMRPNGSTGWIRDRQVDLAANPYRVTVSLHARHLTVTKAGRKFLSAPVGVGKSVTKTPTGTYFVVELLEQTNPSGVYGPFAFGLSAYSNVLYSFGGGPGQIGLHGTNEPGALGSDVSHGCIRVANTTITRLARVLPLGTPVIIQA